MNKLLEGDYYPFGMGMVGRESSALGSYRYGFNGKENDNDISGLGNKLDFGARIYDPRLGNWLSVDPLQSKYPGLSPYNFVNNSPANAYDPDGRLIIFINGWPGFGACCPGTEDYWGGFDKYAMNRIMDHNSMYVDGSSKYLFSLPSTRYNNGYDLGKKHAADVIANLKKDANGDIIESVKIITSSQGAATERGFSQALVEYVNDFNKKAYENNRQELAKQAKALKEGQLYSPNIKKPIIGFNIEFNVDVSAFQGNLLEADKNASENYYMRNGGAVSDWIGPSTWSQKIKGAIELGLDKDGKPKSQGHHPSWFDAYDLPQDKDNVDDAKKPIEYGPNKAAK